MSRAPIPPRPRPASDAPRAERRRERRAPPAAAGTLRWLKALLGRPLVLRRHAGGLRLELQERRRSPERVAADELRAMRRELRRRILEHRSQQPLPPLQPLVRVHEALRRGGWAGVQALGARGLRTPLLLARHLATQERTDVFDAFVDRLALVQAAAEADEDRRLGAHAIAAVEVTEVALDGNDGFTLNAVASPARTAR